MSFIKKEFMGQIKKMWFLSFSLFEVILSPFAAAPGMNVNIYDLIGRSNYCTVLLFLFFYSVLPSNHLFLFYFSTFVFLSFVKAFVIYGPNKFDKSI